MDVEAVRADMQQLEEKLRWISYVNFLFLPDSVISMSCALRAEANARMRVRVSHPT